MMTTNRQRGRQRLARMWSGTRARSKMKKRVPTRMMTMIFYWATTKGLRQLAKVMKDPAISNYRRFLIEPRSKVPRKRQHQLEAHRLRNYRPRILKKRKNMTRSLKCSATTSSKSCVIGRRASHEARRFPATCSQRLEKQPICTPLESSTMPFHCSNRWSKRCQSWLISPR